MTLRRRLLIIGSLLIVSLVAALYFILANILQANFTGLEYQSTVRDAQRVMNAITGELSNLKNITIDYAHWDDTYTFVEDGNPDYITANLEGSGAFASFEIDLILVVKPTGEITYGHSHDLASKQLGPAPAALLKRLQPNDRLLQPPFPAGLAGLVILPEGPLLMAAVPILTSLETGPSRGVMIFGRYLDAAEIERLGQAAQLPFRAHLLDDAQLPANLQSAAAELSASAPLTSQVLNDETVTGLGLLNDLDDQPALLLRIDEARTIFQQGQVSLRYLVIALLAGGVLFALASSFVLERLVLVRVGQLTQTIDRIETQHDLSQRAPVTGRDELARLSKSFNSLTAQLENSVGLLETRVEARTAQLRASAEISRAAASLLEADDLLREVVNLITARFGFYYAAIFTLDDTQQWAELRAASGEGETQNFASRLKSQINLSIAGESVVGAAIATRQARLALDISPGTNSVWPNTRSEIALPLRLGERVLGALDAHSTQSQAFDEASAAVLQTLADQIAMALSNAQLLKQTEATLTNTRNLFAVSQAISAATDIDTLLQTLIEHITPDASQAGLLLAGPRTETGQPAYYEFISTWASAKFVAEKTADQSPTPIRPGARFTPHQLPAISAVTPAQPLIVPDANADEVSPGLRALMRRWDAEALMALALTAGQNPLGMLLVSYRLARTFSADTLQTLMTLSGQAAMVIQNQRSLAEAQAAARQLDVINRRLTGEAWQAYTAPLGGALTIRDVALDRPGEQTVQVSAPIIARGQPIGLLKLQDVDPDRVWSANDRALLEAVANEIAVAIDNARLLEQTERRAQREQLISEISRQLLAASDRPGILQIAGDELSRALRVARTEIKLGADAF